jgi:hypothetical protein
MAAIDVVNRLLREFRRYTGDGLPGEPVNAPLPVGDPQSGVHNPKKSELRAALLAVLEANSSIIEVVASGGTANAQQAVIGENSNMDQALVYFMRVSTDNTGPMTLSVGGEIPRAVLNLAGNPLSAGEWTGVVLFVLNDDGDYQLIIDAGAAASAAQSASDAAESTDLAQAWAEGTEPGGPGTYSAREYAQLLGEGTVGVVGFGPFNGDGEETDFTLPFAPEFPGNVVVFASGVFQDFEARTVTGDQLMFSAPVPNGVAVYGFILVATAVETGIPDVGSVTAASIDAADAANIRSAINAASAAALSTLQENLDAAVFGYLHGLTFSNNVADATNDIDWTAGNCASQQDPPILMSVASGTAQLDAAFGTGSGGRFDSAISDGTWHCFVISNGIDSAVGFSKSLDPTGAANYPSGYTHYRRVFSIVRASSAIIAFKQIGDLVTWDQNRGDYLVNNPGTGGLSATLTVPTGISVVAKFTFGVLDNTSSGDSIFGIATDLGQLNPAPSASNFTIVAPGATAGAVIGASSEVQVVTTTSGAVRLRVSRSDTDITVYAHTKGYIDTRGK